MYRTGIVSSHSFLLNHSQAYHMAFVCAIVEYFVERTFFSWKTSLPIVYTGAVLSVVGLLIRFFALITAEASFTHQVQSKKRSDHTLITGGIYSIFRHPGYFGWFWWTIGSQVLLCNPICILGFAYQAWQFFADRIPDEEEKLIKMFGPAYAKYRDRTPVYIPGIK